MRHFYIEDSYSRYYSVNMCHFIYGMIYVMEREADILYPLIKRYNELSGGGTMLYAEVDIVNAIVGRLEYNGTTYYNDSCSIMKKLLSYDKLGRECLYDKLSFDGNLFYIDGDKLRDKRGLLSKTYSDEGHLLYCYIGRLIEYPYVTTYELRFLLWWIESVGYNIEGVDLSDLVGNKSFYLASHWMKYVKFYEGIGEEGKDSGKI